MVSSRVEKKYSKRSKNQKGGTKTESGTCNVCQTPCSSCIHLNLGHVGLKTEEVSDETRRANAASQYIVDKGEVKGIACEILKKTDSAASNVIKSEQFLEVENEAGRSKYVESHDDGISCVSRASCDNVMACSSNRVLENCSKVVDANDSSPHLHSPKSHSECSSHLLQSCFEESKKVSPKSEVDVDKDGVESLDEATKGKQQVEKPNEFDESAESQSESDESDVVLHDVNVCDICGDVGREDLLATCSRCSDGAEHTYCMKKMLQKVPEGDWLCEECQLAEEIEGQRHDAEENISSKISSHTKSHGKRRAESVIEYASSAKRLATEGSLGSRRPSNPTKVASISQESSFKNLDKGKKRLANFVSQGGNEMLESARSSTLGSQLQTSKGTLTKSNSFSTSNSRPKVKQVDDVLRQEMRRTRELSSKVGSTRVMGKSMSFKSSNSGFSNSSGSKSKILPSKYSRFEDLKRLKSIKERHPSERKALSKLDRSLTFSAMSRVDQKLTPPGETNSTSHTSNNMGPKESQFDGKSSSLTRSNSNACKEVDLPVTSASSADEICSVTGEKLNKVNTNEPSWTADMQDGLTRSLESVNQGEKTKDFSISPSETAISMGLKDALSQKSKEIKIPKDEPKKNNDLKAAIEAAMQKVPGKFAKNKALDRSLELNSEKASQDRPILNKRKAVVSREGTYEAQVNLQGCASDSHRQPTMNNAKQLNFLATDFLRDRPSYGLSVLSAPIPEHMYIWQGAFEVHSAGKINLCDGFQAHLSTGASPNVLEVVDKFSHKMPLLKASRLSLWPTQFQSSGAKEEHVALYFFAKDIESYEKNYKVLVDDMIENDLALKADFDGIDLLIFPSSLLPENSQRWNMLYFLWGVCKRRRVASSKFSNSSDVLSLPEKSVLPLLVNKESSLHDDSNTALLSNISDRTPVMANEASVNKVSLLEQKTLNLKGNLERENNDPDAKLLSDIAPGNELIFPKLAEASPLEEAGPPENKMRIDVLPYIEATGISSGSDKADKKPMDVGVPVASENRMPLKHAPITVVARVEENSQGRSEVRNQQVSSLKKEDSFTNIGGVSDLDVGKKELYLGQPSPTKGPHSDLTETSGRALKIPLDDLNCVFVDEEDSASKKLKTDLNQTHGFGSLVDYKLQDKARDEKILPEKSSNAESYLFPEESVALKRHLSEGRERFPNLNGLRGATEALPNKADKASDAEGCLPSPSFPFPFPFPNKKPNIKPAPDTTEEIQPVDTPVFLFGKLLK